MSIGPRGDDAINGALQQCSHWAHIWRVSFSVPKSVFVAFHNSRGDYEPTPNTIAFDLDDEKTKLARVYVFKYLGSRFTANLMKEWSDHYHHLVGAVTGLTASVARHVGNGMMPLPAVRAACLRPSAP